jgi:hypothetical protein
MFHQLLSWMSQDAAAAGNRGLVIALTFAAAGLVLSVAGARFSRSVYTLVAVAAGALIGLRVPRWMGWELEVMATAMGGALVLGFAGYLLHRAWVGLTLGLLLAAVALGITTHRLTAGGSWSLPAIDPTQPLSEILRGLWAATPAPPARILMIVAGTGLAAGGMLAWVWPRFARVLTFGMLGPAMLVVGALAAVAIARPQWLAQVPQSVQVNGIVLAGLVVLSAVVQWAMCPRMKKASLDAPIVRPPGNRRGPRDVRDLGATPLGPAKIKEAA